MRVSPGMLETKVIVAPNSPRLRPKASTRARQDAGDGERQGDGRKHQPAAGTQAGRRALQVALDGVERQADAAHHEGKPHHRRRQGRTRPAEGQHDAEIAVEKLPDRPMPAEQQQQRITGDDRGQDQRQSVQRLDHTRAGDARAGQQQRHRNGKGQADHHRDRRDAQRQPDRLPFLRRDRVHHDGSASASGRSASRSTPASSTAISATSSGAAANSPLAPRSPVRVAICGNNPRPSSTGLPHAPP